MIEKWFYTKQGVGDDIGDGDDRAVIGDTCKLSFIEEEVGSKSGSQTVEAFDFGIVKNEESVVPDKTVAEGEGVDYEGENQDEQDWALKVMILNLSLHLKHNLKRSIKPLRHNVHHVKNSHFPLCCFFVAMMKSYLNSDCRLKQAANRIVLQFGCPGEIISPRKQTLPNLHTRDSETAYSAAQCRG